MLFRRTVLLMSIGFAALLLIVATTGWLFLRTSTYTQDLVAARQLRVAAVDLRALVQDAESGQRGFLLTGKEKYLQPFDAAVQGIPQKLEVLHRQLSGDPALAASVQDLETRIGAKVAELSQTVALTREGRTSEALAIVDSDLGKSLMDDARGQFAAIIDHADRRFAASVGAQRRMAGILQAVATVAAIVIFLVVGLALLTALRHARALALAREQIEALNIGLEDKVRLRTRDLARANEEIQRFAYIVTHDLRAPLVNIMGFTREVETTLPDLHRFVHSVPPETATEAAAEARQAVDEDLPEAIGFIRSSTQKMDGLINAILKLSREGLRVQSPQPVDLTALFQEASAVVRHPVIAAGGEIRVDNRASPIVSDRVFLEQIIGNLMDNAVKYSVAGRAPQITLRAFNTTPGWFAIEVQDNGRGIGAQDHDRIFDLFRRSGAQDKPGEGLGLAHVRASVRSLGGDITLTSRLGEGTTFTISLPRDLAAVLRSNVT